VTLSTIGSVVLVGAGKMGLALAHGWLTGGLPPDDLTLVDPKPAEATLAFARDHRVKLQPSIVGATPRVLVLAVKPQVMAAVLAEIKPAVRKDTLALSIAAGISIAALSKGLGTDNVVRTMPNTPAQVGKGMSGAVANPVVSAEDRTRVDALMRAAGELVWFDDEAMIDAVTSVSGSGPAYVFHMVEALAAAGVKQGLSDEQAMLLARQTIIGAAALLEAEPDIPASVLRQNVTSPKGTTAEALAVLMGEGGMTPLLERAVSAARRRSEELGRE
jgi:pyrroline-5-carboxylate reductase